MGDVGLETTAASEGCGLRRPVTGSRHADGNCVVTMGTNSTVQPGGACAVGTAGAPGFTPFGDSARTKAYICLLVVGIFLRKTHRADDS
jgi:hypothetical protein